MVNPTHLATPLKLPILAKNRAYLDKTLDLCYT